MNNKKGFTLIELSISVTLLSLVMVFMFKFISEIRKDEDTVGLQTEMLLIKSIISKTINTDVKNSGGISSLSCTSAKCTIDLKDNTTKIIEITNGGTILKYTDTTKNEILLTRKLPSNYAFYLNKKETNQVFILEISIPSNKEYNIEIVNNKS